jgi:transposase
LASDGPPKYQREPAGSVVDEVEPRIRELLQAYPTMPATVVAERIGWSRSIRVLRARVAELRPVYLPPDPASRTEYVAGEIAQCDLWFPPIDVPVGCGQVRRPTQLPVLTMVTGYSRWLSAVLLPTRSAPDLFAGWWQLLSTLGAVPRVLVWDGEGAIGRWRAGRPELTADCHAFRGTLGAKVLVCKPADPEAKGLIERAHDYLERSFLPGRTFTGPADFNTQLQSWLSWSTGGSGGRWAAPRPTGSSPTAPRCSAAAGRAGHRLAGLDPPRPGSLRPAGQQRLLDLPGGDRPTDRGRRDLQRVQAFSDGRLVADHERLWAWHQTGQRPGPRRRGPSAAPRSGRGAPADPGGRRRTATVERLRHRARPGRRPRRRGGRMTARRGARRPLARPATSRPRSRS